MTALLASGRDADVYALDERRGLRRYRKGGDAPHEAAVMRYVADHGYPVPPVYQADRADLLPQRLGGPPMLPAPGPRPRPPASCPPGRRRTAGGRRPAWPTSDQPEPRDQGAPRPIALAGGRRARTAGPRFCHGRPLRSPGGHL